MMTSCWVLSYYSSSARTYERPLTLLNVKRGEAGANRLWWQPWLSSNFEKSRMQQIAKNWRRNEPLISFAYSWPLSLFREIETKILSWISSFAVHCWTWLLGIVLTYSWPFDFPSIGHPWKHNGHCAHASPGLHQSSKSLSNARRQVLWNHYRNRGRCPCFGAMKSNCFHTSWLGRVIFQWQNCRSLNHCLYHFQIRSSSNGVSVNVLWIQACSLVCPCQTPCYF
mmetsp:Transcript_18509/g.53562  ORF Transcript_18509/g.53562 Transcript_18509/m.53562 type:complete len:225 (+) Transcript_18509:250-924(+)